MSRQQQKDGDFSGARPATRRAAISDAVWAAQDRLRTGLGEAFRTGAELIRSPFERSAWALRRGVVWPIEDRAGNLGRPARALGFGAVVLLAAGAGVAGLIWAAPDRPGAPAASETTALVSAPPARTPSAPAEDAPTLHGASPVFAPTPGGVSPARTHTSKDTASPAPKSSTASAGAATSSASTASTSSKPTAVDGPPAGPAAVAVARDFAGAFVLYETGKGGDSDVREAFGETATPELSRSLLHRPPRLPANVTVPKAKVVNVVAGPSHGQVYTMSVALLRVGLTSELRLEMEQMKGDGWRVTNVLG